MIMAENTVQTAVETKAREERAMPQVTRDENRYQVPPVDIYEQGDDLVVVADLPGVDRDGLKVRVDEDLLTIEGHVSKGSASDQVLREYELVDYYRQFRLSEEIDPERISAELKHGVLTLVLPKAEVAKPRQIEVRVC